MPAGRDDGRSARSVHRSRLGAAPGAVRRERPLQAGPLVRMSPSCVGADAPGLGRLVHIGTQRPAHPASSASLESGRSASNSSRQRQDVVSPLSKPRVTVLLSAPSGFVDVTSPIPYSTRRRRRRLRRTGDGSSSRWWHESQRSPPRFAARSGCHSSATVAPVMRDIGRGAPAREPPRPRRSPGAPDPAESARRSRAALHLRAQKHVRLTAQVLLAPLP